MNERKLVELSDMEERIAGMLDEAEAAGLSGSTLERIIHILGMDQTRLTV